MNISLYISHRTIWSLTLRICRAVICAGSYIKHSNTNRDLASFLPTYDWLLLTVCIYDSPPTTLSAFSGLWLPSGCDSLPFNHPPLPACEIAVSVNSHMPMGGSNIHNWYMYARLLDSSESKHKTGMNTHKKNSFKNSAICGELFAVYTWLQNDLILILLLSLPLSRYIFFTLSDLPTALYWISWKTFTNVFT